MHRPFSVWSLFILPVIGMYLGCKPQLPAATDPPPAPAAYFTTPFQNESQFIVEAIVSDLAEQISYASSHQLPDKQTLAVAATEKPGSPPDAPVYELRIRLGSKPADIRSEANINGPIWSPAIYQAVAAELARAVGLKSRNPGKQEGTTLLAKLADGAAQTIEQENQAVSAALEQDFCNPDLHEQAALLLGAFLLREHSGYFFEVRSPLSRITAHLAMARLLRGNDPYGLSGRIAEAILLTLMEDQAPALERLNGLGTNDNAVAATVRALRALNTGDYRPLDEVKERTPIENAAWFYERANYIATSSAWEKLSDDQKQTIDFVRIANDLGYTVEIGHELLRASLPLEQQEISSIYELWHHAKPPDNGMVRTLNDLPERCFTASGGVVHVRVIGWGQWAAFFQRHLCHAVQQNFWFLNRQWGVPDEAKKFSSECEREFGALRLYPFVRRFNCTDVEGYHKSVDDGLKVTVATPHLVPADCWNELCYKPRFAPLYSPNPNPHINEWFGHNPPPGTVYNLRPRLDHPSLVERPDAVARFQKLHELAPYDCRIALHIAATKYNQHPTYEQATALFGALLPYSVTALQQIAATLTNSPERYEKLMLQAAELSPGCYYTLGDYARNGKQEDKAARYYDKACAADPDRVRVANYANWRSHYYLKQGNPTLAREIADEAGEVYSFYGLEAKASFLEATTNYDGAFEWFAKIEERYNNSTPVIRFCLRYKAQTGDGRFDSELQQRRGKLFPKGLERVSLNDFNGPPADGVLVAQENDRLKSAGLKAGDVIVAVYGVRVHNLDQYAYGRDLTNTPALDLIVWQSKAYREFKPSPPRHLFGVPFLDYSPKPARPQ
jgi:tetratricopeptide (TPR) repeat protein